MDIQITKEHAVRSVRGVNNLVEKTSNFVNRQGLEPIKDSIADKELRTFFRPESLITSYSQGVSLIEVVGDHTISLVRTLTEPVLTLAPWTILRAALEASALSSWLLDTSISPHTRVGRSLAFRYEGFVQQIKLGQVANSIVERDKVNARIEEVETIAINMGFNKLRNKKGERMGIGQVMPKITGIIRDTLQEEANYRLLSAMAHAHPWAYSRLGFMTVGETNFQANKTFLLQKNITPDAIVWLCSQATMYFVHPIKLQCKLYGWDTQNLEIIHKEYFREISIVSA